MLLSSCQQSTNGYSCLCSSQVNVTSLCYNITASILSLNVSAFSGTISDSIFEQNANVIRLLSQLPNFNSSTITLTAAFITSLDNFGNVLETFTNTIRRNSISTVSPNVSL